MADRYLLESSSVDGYLLEDGSGVLLLDAPAVNYTLTCYPGEYAYNGENQLLYSEEFDNAAWEKIDSSCTANAIQTPFGGGDLVIPNTSNTAHFVRQLFIAGGLTAVGKLRAKAGGYDRLQVYFSDGGGYGHSTFNLTLGTKEGDYSGGVTVSGAIKAIGGGLYELKVSASASSPLTIFGFCLLDAGVSASTLGPSFVGDGASGVYLAGAQFSAADVGYVKTTSAAVAAPTATLLRSKLITASAGAYAYTGKDAILTKGGLNNYVLTALAGSYAYVGVSAGLSKNRGLTAQAGAYTYTGQSATLLRSKRIVSTAGAYTYTGQSATLKKSKLLIASAGSYAYTGVSSTLRKSKLLTASAGAYAYTGQSATLTKSVVYTLTAQSGAYAYTGQSANLLRSKLIEASPGAYAYTGQDATLTKTTSGNYVLTCLTWNYPYTGNSATITRTGGIESVGGAYFHRRPDKKELEKYIRAQREALEIIPKEERKRIKSIAKGLAIEKMENVAEHIESLPAAIRPQAVEALQRSYEFYLNLNRSLALQKIEQERENVHTIVSEFLAEMQDQAIKMQEEEDIAFIAMQLMAEIE